MSYKKHNFGDNVCNYYDREDYVNYVRPCDTGYYCQDTESNNNGADNKHNLHTCQKYMHIPPNPSTPKKDINEKCDNTNDCISGLTCSGTDPDKKCNIQCTSSDQTHYLINGKYECRYGSFKDKCQYTDANHILQSYTRRNKCKVCGKINFAEKKDDSQKIYYVISSVDENDKYSQPDNTFVSDKDACQSGTALYFYGDGSIQNDIDNAHASENVLYYKCVTIKAVDHSNKRFNYTIGDDTIHIYDIKEVEYDNVDTNNDGISDKKTELTNLCTKYLMTEIGLWNDNKDEYINYLKCTDDNQADDNLKRKLYYLDNPEEYLLYKDQTEVMEYLIQKEYPEIVPIIKAKEEEGAGFLNSKYLILSLLLLFL